MSSEGAEPDNSTIRIGDVTLSLDEAQETLNAIRAGKVDAVVVEGTAGSEIFAFRDPSHPFRLLVEAMNEGAVLTTPDGTISYQNPCFTKLAGAARPDRGLHDVVRPEQRDDLRALLERVRNGPARGNVELIGAAGGLVPVQLSMSRASLADVEVLCVVVADLTEQTRQEELYREARMEIVARDRLFSVVAHELRNPLGVLAFKADQLAALFGSTAEGGVPLPVETAATLLTRMRAQIERIGDLVTKLLDVGSIGSGRMRLEREDLDLAELTRAVVERLREQIDRSKSSVSLDLDAVRGRWDRIRIEQVIENLVSNAVKYGQGEPIRVLVRGNDDVARLTVEDRGRGIPEEARERIFRPYERLAQADNLPGLGIGLFITAEIVKAHDGFIRVVPRQGGGSRFVVELPRADPLLH